MFWVDKQSTRLSPLPYPLFSHNQRGCCYLWSMDAVPEVLHPRLTRRRAGDAAAYASGRVLPHRATWIPRVFSRFTLTWLRLEPIRTKLGWLGPYRLKWPKQTIQAEIQKKKKKKDAKHTVWLISKPYFSSLHTKRQNINSLPLLTFRLSLIFVLSASLPFCLCFVSLVAMRHSATQHSLSLLLQFILSSAFSHAFLTQVSL